MATGQPMIVFATQRYRPLAEAVIASTVDCLEAGERELRAFPDGERYQRVAAPVVGRDVAVVGGTASDEDTLELYDLACGLTMNGARSLTLLVPYFGYSTMERAVRAGEVVTAKTRARLLSSIPPADVGNRVVLLDLHVAGIPHYFEAGLTPVHLYAKELILAAARRLGGESFVFACTDAGRAKWVESLANDAGVRASFVFKRRLDGATTEVSAVSAQVEGARVVIYDDMIRSGSSLLNAAAAYRDAGATSIVAIATHGVFPGDAVGRLRASGLLERVVVTDSHPRVGEVAGTPPADGFLEVVSIGPLLGAFLAGAHN